MGVTGEVMFCFSLTIKILSDGLTINGATMDESGKNAREICYGGKDGSGNGDWTSIPTAAIRANGHRLCSLHEYS